MSIPPLYQYSFNALNGQYMGLVKAETDPFTKTLIFPGNSTKQEPPWRDGFVPVWDFHRQCWMIQKPDQVKIQSDIELRLGDRIQPVILWLKEIDAKMGFQFGELSRFNEKRDEIFGHRTNHTNELILKLEKQLEDIRFQIVDLVHSENMIMLQSQKEQYFKMVELYLKPWWLRLYDFLKGLF